MSQLSMDELMADQKRKNELDKPAKQQIPTADVVMFTGVRGVTVINGKDYPKRLQTGKLAFVCGSRSGPYDTMITTRQESLWVSYLDLKPMKVSEF